METSQHLWATSSSVLPLSKEKKLGIFSLCLGEISWFSVCASWLLPLQCQPLRGVQLQLLLALPPTIYLNTLIRSLLSLLLLRLNSHSSLSFSSQSRFYFIILVAVCWTYSSISSSTFYWGAQQWVQYWKRFVVSRPVFVYVDFTNSMKGINFHLMKGHF